MDSKPKLPEGHSAGSTATASVMPLRGLTAISISAKEGDGGTCTVHDDVEGAEESLSLQKSPYLKNAPSVATKRVRTLPSKLCSKCRVNYKERGRGKRLCTECKALKPVKRRRKNPTCTVCHGPKDRTGLGEHECTACFTRPMCRRCHNRRVPPGEGHQFCAACEKDPHVCSKCLKPESAYGRLMCQECTDKKRRPRPCRNCHEVTVKYKGKHYCEECETYVPQALAIRRRAREGMKRTPCTRCSRPKGPGVGRRLCEACRTNKVVKICLKCNKNPVRPGTGVRYCIDCYYLSPWYYRQQRRGTRIAEKDLGSRKTSLPGYPVSRIVRDIAKRNGDGLVSAVCRRAGITDRSISRWEYNRENITFGQADKVLVGLGLCWWDVWKLPESERVGNGSALEVCAYLREMERDLDAYYRARWLFDDFPVP